MKLIGRWYTADVRVLTSFPPAATTIGGGRVKAAPVSHAVLRLHFSLVGLLQLAQVRAALRLLYCSTRGSALDRATAGAGHAR